MAEWYSKEPDDSMAALGAHLTLCSCEVVVFVYVQMDMCTCIMSAKVVNMFVCAELFLLTLKASNMSVLNVPMFFVCIHCVCVCVFYVEGCNWITLSKFFADAVLSSWCIEVGANRLECFGIVDTKCQLIFVYVLRCGVSVLSKSFLGGSLS